MGKVIYKWFWEWNFDKEEQWLNEMAANGLALISAGLCRYKFEDCAPDEYKICMQLLGSNQAKNAKYIEFLEETGVEHVGTCLDWYYFRKRVTGDDFQLFSDHNSLLKHLTKIIRYTVTGLVLNFFVGCLNVFLCVSEQSPINILGILNILVFVFGMIGLIRTFQKRKKLRMEQQIFE